MLVKKLFRNTFFPAKKRISRRGMDIKIISKTAIIIFLVMGILGKSFSWLYEEYVGSGAVINVGKISHIVSHYDSNGNLIDDNNDTQTLL